jgi:RNA polymerase sigma factor (sigma-70 family)
MLDEIDKTVFHLLQLGAQAHRDEEAVHEQRVALWDKLLVENGLLQFLETYIKYKNYTSTPTEDIVQDVIMALFVALEGQRYDHRGSFRAYAITIANNKIHEEYRRTKRTVPIDELEKWPHGVSQNFDRGLHRMELKRAMKMLSTTEARIIKRVNEIACQLRLNPNTVSKNKERALKKLYAILKHA